MEPEIARRCTSCGATVREHAAFCPQCGGEIPQRDRTTSPDIQPPASDETKSAEKSRTDQPAEVPETASVKTKQEENDEPRDVDHSVRHNEGGRLHRTTVAAREAIEHGVMQPVDRIRKASHVVIDQAAYDPSVRFLVIAAALLILFLFVMLLNRVIG